MSESIGSKKMRVFLRPKQESSDRESAGAGTANYLLLGVGHWWLEILHRPFPLFLEAIGPVRELTIVVPDDLPKWALQRPQAIYGSWSEQLVTIGVTARLSIAAAHCCKA